MSSPSPSPRKRASTIDSPTRSWNTSNARIPVERPVSALRTPYKKLLPGTPRGIPLPNSPAPKFDLSTAIAKPSSPTRFKAASPKKELKEFEIPTFDFSMRGNTLQKPPALRRKPLMATPGQAASHIQPMAKTPGVAMSLPDKPHAARATIEPALAIGLRVKNPIDVPLPETPIVARSSRMVNRLKPGPQSVPLPASPVVLASTRTMNRLKQGPELVPLLASPAAMVIASVPTKPTKPTLRIMHMRSSSEASQASVAKLEQLSPGTKKHIAPQLLDKETAATGKPTHPQIKRNRREAAKAALDGSGLGLSPTKAVKVSAVHFGPSKAQPAIPHPAIDGAFRDPKSPPAASPKLERQVGPNGETFLVSSKPLRLQTRVQVSPRSGVSRSVPVKEASSKGKGPAMTFQTTGYGSFSGSNNRLVSDSTSVAADDERDPVLSKLDLERKKSASEAHVLAVDPKMDQRKPSPRRTNTASDSVAADTSKHYESIEYQAKQYIAQTFKANSFLELDNAAQKELKTSPLIEFSPLKQPTISVEEAAYQAMLKKAHIDERPKPPIRLARPRSRHRFGSSGQTQVASDVRNGSSSEFSVDFLKSDASQKIIQQTFVKLDMYGGWSKEAPSSPVREPVSPSKTTQVAEGRNFSRLVNVSPSERVSVLDLRLPFGGMQPYGNGFHLSSDHPLSPFKNMSRPVVPSSSTIRSNDSFEHFEDVDLGEDLSVINDADVNAALAFHGTSLDELHSRAAELQRQLDAIPKTEYVGDQFVDEAAELGVILEDIAPSHSMQRDVDNQLLREQASAATDLTHVATVEPPHKSALIMSHRGSVSSHKSVRWDPSIDEVNSPVVQEKGKGRAVDTVAEVGTEDRKSPAELSLERLFMKTIGDNGDDVAAAFGVLMTSFKESKRKGNKNKLANFVEMLRKIDVSSSSEEEETEASPVEAPVAVAPPAKLNPLVPEFTPRNVKENQSWSPASASKTLSMVVSPYDIENWRKPPVARGVALHDPSFDRPSSSDGNVGDNLFHDPAVLSVSPGHKRAGNFGLSSFDASQQSMSLSENFVDSLFDSGDSAILRVGQSPSRRRAISDQTFATTGAVSMPGTATTQTVRKRVIWDDPDEPGGREVSIMSSRFVERTLARFVEKYPLTGQKAKVLPKKKLEDLPKKYDEELLLNGVASLKPQKLATDAADVQQRLELLLLKKKEAKVKKMRLSSGQLSEWGV